MSETKVLIKNEYLTDGGRVKSFRNMIKPTPKAVNFAL
jgi:hypothetical protein